MSTNIYTSIAASVSATPADRRTIEETVDIVKSGTYEEIVRTIRNTDDAAEQKKLKAENLPVFYPCIRLSADGSVGEDSEPTGIIQFDVDMKDNLRLDFDTLKKEVVQHPACLYAFMSPSGGLKFGMLTDFSRADGESSESMKLRFGIAYHLCLQQIENHCAVQFIHDPSCRSIRQSCFLSHDVEAFCRGDCDAIVINDQCNVPAPPPMRRIATEDAEPEVCLALDQIPRELGYQDRLQINLCVLWMLGSRGIPILRAHWLKEDRAKLEQQLEDCLTGAKYGNLGLLWSYAVDHGYVRPTGKTRWKLQPEPYEYQLPPLATPEEATGKLQSIVSNFVTTKKSQFVNVTAGAGKTRTVLEALSREVRHTDKVLFLVPTHKLAAEIVDTYNEIRKRDAENATSLRGKIQRGTVIALKGRDALCENNEALERFGEVGLAIPPIYCSNECMYRGECHYTMQFNSFANIRVMTHQEWSNQEGGWFNGSMSSTRGGIEPRKDGGKWKPDFIVIDENVFTMADALVETGGSKLSSISMIVDSVKDGSQFADAVRKNRHDVIEDSLRNHPAKNPPFTTMVDYISAYKRVRTQNAYSEILHRLAEYCKLEDESLLDGMFVKNDAIEWHRIKLPDARYAKVPTLYLDATASRKVVQHLLPDVPFHQIAVRQREDVRLYQLWDKTITKDFLKNAENLQLVIEGLRSLVAGYERVGLITYKSIGENKEFASALAKSIGAVCWNHFGNLRGLNTLENVDCLLVVGRHALRTTTSAEYAGAIFGHHAAWSQKYADLPVRMKDGRTFKLNNYLAENDFHRAVYEHFSLAETLQAIGRARPVHGSKKDIYVFANEHLTTNIEVADFFSYEDHFVRRQPPAKDKPNIISDEVMEAVQQRGYLHWMQGELSEQLNLTQSQVKRVANKVRIEEELLGAGFQKMTLSGRFEKGSKWSREYFIFDDTANLERALVKKGERLTAKQ